MTVDAEIDPDGFLDNPRLAFMLHGSARTGSWLLYTDLLYASLGGEDSEVRRVTGPAGQPLPPLGRSAGIDVNTTIWDLGGGRMLVQRPDWHLELVAGLRYLDQSRELTLTLADPQVRTLGTRALSLGQRNWDGIVGFRGMLRIPNSRWFVPFHADIGTGASELTWQAVLGLGYRFDWGQAGLAWRTLAYEFDDGNEVRLSGPSLGVGFSW